MSENSPAARLADILRAEMKQQGLTGAALAERVERLTGTRPNAMWVTRRLNGDFPLVRVSPDLIPIAAALGVDPFELVEAAIIITGRGRSTLAVDQPRRTPAEPLDDPDGT